MQGKIFLDTNIFVYTQSKDDTNKRDIALKAIKNYECYTSTQVLNEVSNVMIKKLKMPICEVKQVIFAINKCCDITNVTYETVQKALDLKEKYGYSYYDSLILSAAILIECDYVCSEDLHDGQILDYGIEIVNIFNQNL